MSRKRFLTWKEFSRTYVNAYRYLKKKRASKNFLKICDRLQKDGNCDWPEVTMRQAVFLTGFPERKILKALQQWKLRGRKVWGDDFIPLIDLWHFYKVQKENRR